MRDVFSEIITNNKKMKQIFVYIESIAQTSQPVLITGETGVGKEIIARSIHNHGKLKGRLVTVNVAGLDDIMFSDTLFGHAKGAFTGADKVRNGLIEMAAEGTLFLDEIGEASLTSQVKLLRLLQEGEYMPLGQDTLKYSYTRIIAATNKDLWSLQRFGKFREDLNFRIRTHHIHIPSLRERMDDIPLLIDHFLEKTSSALNKKKPAIPEKLLTLLGTYSFPGNIRELEALIFDGVARHKSGMLSLNAFASHIRKKDEERLLSMELQPEAYPLATFPEKLPTIKQLTHLLVAEAMKRANGNQSVAAKMIGISHQALSKRLKKEVS